MSGKSSSITVRFRAKTAARLERLRRVLESETRAGIRAVDGPAEDVEVTISDVVRLSVAMMCRQKGVR